MGFRLPTHSVAAAGALTFQCWNDRPYCASAQLNHLSILWPDRQIIERTLTGKARMNAHKDRIPETERVKEKKKPRVERGAEDVPMEPGNRGEEQIAVRHAGACGGDITENQHEGNRMREKSIRGSE